MATVVLRFGERVEKNKDNVYRWNELFTYRKGKLSTESLLGHKSVICFAGDGTNTNEELNGCCSRVESMLLHGGMKPQDMPHLYALGFDSSFEASSSDLRKQVFDDTDEIMWTSKKRNGEKHFKGENSDHPQVFFNAYLKPLIVNEDGSVRSKKEIEKNLQNLTIVTHCHGSVFAYCMEQLFQKELSNAYSEKEATDLLQNLRMIHFASRRPMNTQSVGKHFHVISAAGDEDAIDTWVSYDNLHKALHRLNMEHGSSALLPISQNESILLGERFVGLKDGKDDHEYFLSAFGLKLGSEKVKLSPEAKKSISITQQLLRTFVEHPEQVKGMIETLASIDDTWTRDNQSAGMEIIRQILEEHDRDAKLISFFGKYAGSIGSLRLPIKDYVKGKESRGTIKKISQRQQVKLRRVNKERREFLFQKDSENQILYERIKAEYLKTGDDRSLVNMVKLANSTLPTEEAIELIKMAVKNGQWNLYREVTKVTYWDMKDIVPVLLEVDPNALPHMIPLMKKTIGLTGNEEVISQLMEKSKKIKNSTGRVALQAFLHTAEEKIKECKAYSQPQQQTCQDQGQQQNEFAFQRYQRTISQRQKAATNGPVISNRQTYESEK